MYIYLFICIYIYSYTCVCKLQVDSLMENFLTSQQMFALRTLQHMFTLRTLLILPNGIDLVILSLVP